MRIAGARVRIAVPGPGLAGPGQPADRLPLARYPLRTPCKMHAAPHHGSPPVGPSPGACHRLAGGMLGYDQAAPRRRPEFARGPGSATVLNAHPPGRIRSDGGAPARGRGSVGRASPCQGEGRGFESRRPLGGAGFRLAGPWPARLFGCPRPDSPAGNVGAGGMAEWLRQGPAKPCTRVRFPLPPRGRLAQRESASLTRKRSLVQSQYRPPVCAGQRPVPVIGNRPQDHLPSVCHQDTPVFSGRN